MARAPTRPRGPRATPLEAAGRQLAREWRTWPPHKLSIAGPKPRGLAARARDARPASAEAGQRLLRGEFTLPGGALDVGPGGDPWNCACPSEAFAQALHEFGWMGDLLAAGEAGTREGLRLWRGWRRLFGRSGRYGWAGRILERRVFNLVCAAPALLAETTDVDGGVLLADIARQARHLIGDPADPGRAAERACVVALAGAALAGAPGERLLKEGLRRLERVAPTAVLADGVHASRAPERGLELLFDLASLDDALSQRGVPAPVEAARANDRLAGAARLFSGAERRLARFHGGEGGDPARTGVVLALEAARSHAVRSAPYGGFERLEGRELQLVVDAGAPPSGAWSGEACAQPGALELWAAGRRLVLGSAWSAAAPGGAWLLRGPEGGSCLGVGDAWPAPAAAKAERREAPEGIWLDLAHEGWRADFGLVHSRRLFLDLGADDLRGEDQLAPAGRGRSRGPAPFAIRFQLDPRVSAQVAADGRSALLRPAGGIGWRLRSDAGQIALTQGTVFEDGGARQASVLVLAGRTTVDGARIRWKLSRDEGG